jgi:shikimate dehydrogenase
MKQFGLIGKSLSHSFSQSYFTKKFHDLGIEASYQNLEFNSIDDLRLAFSMLRAEYDGLNVTIPYKSDIISMVDEVDIHAQHIGAINCIVMKNGRAKGYNTDYLGFIQTVSSTLHSSTSQAYILGTGGSSKAVDYALKQYFHIPTIHISRTNGDMTYAEFNKLHLPKYSIIVNTTPLGMFPDILTYPPIDYTKLDSSHVCIDLVYNPEETVFLKKAKERGAATKNGFEMLIRQAECSWDLWKKASEDNEE